jgi:hypothetical protein
MDFIGYQRDYQSLQQSTHLNAGCDGESPDRQSIALGFVKNM